MASATLARRLLPGLLFLPLALGAQGRIVTDSVRSPALEGNLLGDNPVRPLLVYLPPGYPDPDGRRYPVLYLLHGFDDSPAIWSGGFQGVDLTRVMDSLIGAGRLPPMLVAMPDGHSLLGGAFFSNSGTTGGWETYLVRDVVRTVDARYRTLRKPASRGIAGHSLGAGAALRLAMRFPGIFASAYGMSFNAAAPCGLTPGQVTMLLALRTMEQLFGTEPAVRNCVAHAAAWAPDSTRPPFYAALPWRESPEGPTVDSTVLERFGAWELLEMAPRYREGLIRLRGLGFDVGRSDPRLGGVSRLDSLLTRLRVRHTFSTYDGDHNSGIGNRLRTVVLPFFSATLDTTPTLP